MNEEQAVTDGAQVVMDHGQVVMQEVAADAGYHKAGTLVFLEQAQVRSYIAEKDEPRRRKWTDKPDGFPEAHYANRRRVKGERGKALLRKRGELIERSFAHSCETGGGRRMWLRGLTKAGKRWLGLLMGFNLGIIMRALFGIGSSRSLQTGGPLREVLATALQMRIPVFSTACAAPQSARNALGAILRSLRYFCIHSTAPTGKLPQERSPIAA